MKVLFITREGYQLAGARVRCYNFARELGRRGIAAKVFSFADDLGAKCGEKELEMSAFAKLRLNIKAFGRLIKEPRDTVFILQRLNYHTLAPLLVSFFKRNPVVFDCDDWNIRENPVYHFGFYPSSKMEWLTRVVSRKASVCIAASKFLKDYLKRFNPNVYYLPTGVDTELFGLREERKSPEIVYSWIGTAYHPEMAENLCFLLDCFSEAAARNGHMRLSLAGEGKYFEQFKEAVKLNKYADKIKIYPWIPPEKIPEYLAQTDVGLLPLIQDTKFNRAKSPTKLFEYMSMGKATISSRRGEAAAVIRDGETGFLAEGRAEFVSRMCCLAEDETLRKKMGRSARNEAERNYSLTILGERLADILKEIRHP
ncbi:MAG: GDP-mannose-dependent alpha-(1-6)-phosphatidylinositol monomannoside mannosyltransferase [Candidatus Omnitrophica bacterium ADurb.Bin277]|nr:MAG: GDP-mannose-dependent alpha-(1-6)-phosphatidylinositol monomannoside mannosyltransferase [Candidatus Omnitrophica bacterium ADurb.Bin277]